MKTKLWTSTKADQLFSKWVRQRDPWCIFKCGRPSTQNSHFWGRGNSSTRYEPDNCDGICGKCHFTHEGNKQGRYTDIKIKQLGVTRYQELRFLAHSVVKRSDAITKLMSWLK